MLSIIGSFPPYSDWPGIHGFSIDYDFFADSLDTGSYTFLFDGLDEVKEEKLRVVVNSIQDFSNRYRDNRFIVSTRPIWNCDIWDNYTLLTVCGLTKRQSISLVSKIRYDPSRKEMFLKDLNDKLYKKHPSFASNPLLLSMMLLTYDEHTCIPEQLTDFYEQAFLTLFNIHDSRKNFTREICSQLEYGPFKEVFAHFCFQTFFLSHYRFTEPMLYEYLEKTKKKLKIQFSTRGYFQDLVNLVCMIVYDGLQLQFIHRSFQEYFAAVYVTTLPDDIQRKILRPLLDDLNRYKAFLGLLSSLEEKRYYENIVIPVFQELMKEYAANGSSYQWLLELFYTGVSILIEEKNEEPSIGYSTRPSSSAYRYVIDFLSVGRYSSPQKRLSTKPTDQRLINALIDASPNNLDFTELSEMGLIDSVIDYADWIFDEFNKAAGAYERYRMSNKRTINDIGDLLSDL